MRLVTRIGLPPLPIPLLCSRCIRGDHSRDHTAMGCIWPIGSAPHDFVCRCEKPPTKKETLDA